MDYKVTAYIIYLALAILLTVWVATTLFKNGRVFLVDIFKGNKELADSVNKLLLVGFYLINIGYAVFALKMAGEVGSMQVMLEKLSLKLGVLIFFLGIMHFINLFVFFNLRKKAKPHPPQFRPPKDITIETA